MFVSLSRTPIAANRSGKTRPWPAARRREQRDSFWKMMLDVSEVAVRHHYAASWLNDAHSTASH